MHPSDLDRAVARTVLTGGGVSGSLIERVVLEDGRRVVVKHVDASRDWLMRATSDDGRAVTLWTSGVMERMPDVIDHAVIGAWQERDGGVVAMRDVSDRLFEDSARVSRGESRRVLAAVAALHDLFRADPPTGLCTLAARYTMLSPVTARLSPDDVVPGLIGRGWERFADAVPGDVADVILRLLDDPAPLVAPLAEAEPTLIHGDLKLANLGLAPDRVVVLDWGTQTGVAPPAVEYVWYLAINGSRFEATHDEVLADIRAIGSGRDDEHTLDVALVGALVQLGWNKALDALECPDPEKRAEERRDLDWWVATVRTALEAWSP